MSLTACSDASAEVWMAAVEMPDSLAEVLRPIVDHVVGFSASARAGTAEFKAAEVTLGELFATAETSAVGELLSALEPTSELVEVGGRAFRRLKLGTSGHYHTLRGTVGVPRALYREVGVRNGPTVVPMELRAGIVEGSYTPAAARGVATLAQALPSREADLVTKALGVLPHSRSSQQRAGISVGQRVRNEAGRLVVTTLEVPEEAASVSVAVDRVSMPMAEAREATAEDVEAGVKRPITVAFRMAYSGVLTLYDGDGEPLTCLRHAHVPSAGRQAIQDALSADLQTVMDQRPDLRVVALSDGAPEMQSVVDQVTSPWPSTRHLTDFWHLTEHLAAALRDTGRYVPDVLGDWKGQLLARDDAIESIEQELHTWALEYDKSDLPQGLHDALTFIENRPDRLRYASAREDNLPIASGSAEATCKTIVTSRMKRPGARWTEHGAQPILDLRALATSMPRRWEAALDAILNSYTLPVIELPSSRRISR